MMLTAQFKTHGVICSAVGQLSSGVQLCLNGHVSKPTSKSSESASAQGDEVARIIGALERVEDNLGSQLENLDVRMDLLFYHLGMPTQDFIIDYGDESQAAGSSTPTLKPKK